MAWWEICYKCNGTGYIDKNECLICKYYIIEGREDLILRGQLYISDNTEPVSPVSSPR
jgi:hypothetical protein